MKAGTNCQLAEDADVLGIKQKVPCMGWRMTEAARKGEIPMDAEKLAGGMA